MSGIVVDRGGHPVRGATVELMNPQNNTPLSTTTTDHCGFCGFMVSLEEWEYEVKVTYHMALHVQKAHAPKGQLFQMDFKI